MGFIIAGYAYVLRNGRRAVDADGLQDDDPIPGYRKMTEAVRDAGGKE